MQPTLDVIIPCYNAANTLRAAAESALAQSVVQTVWLVDDASDDGTPGIMRELAAQYPQIRCEYLPSNGGAARARNWGALQSQADFTAFLDADDAYEVSALLPAYTALSRFTYLSLVRLKLRPVRFPNRYLTHPDFNRAWQQLEMTVGGNTVFPRNTLLACGGFPQDEIFRTFGGEDAALGIALTRSSVVGTLFGEQDAAVCHTYRPNIHAERLLELALFGISDQKITTKHFQQAEAVTERICRKLEELKLQIALEQNGIMPLLTSYAD
ncbi:TPA: glycosyltransferase family 2 protein [Neisseria elongata]